MSRAPMTVAEFAAFARYKPHYVRILRMAGRLVLAEDGTRILPDESLARIEATRERPEPKPAPPAELAKVDFAAYLEAQPAYVTELQAAGRLLLTDDGRRVRVAESLALIRDTADPAKAGVAARHAAQRAAGGAGQAAAPVVPPAPAGGDDELPDSYGDPVQDSHARRRAKALADKAETDAKAAERDYRLSLGQLLEAEEVEHAIRGAVTTFRGALENLPSTLAPELAAISDEGRVRVVLGEAIEHALEELARKFSGIAKAEEAHG